ncbi:hypothetical protein GUITHDRAFT_108439 [Guillardia theta CCMP2712]|uniref:OTU domain-containing protein n=1 Tax=Guillardia theta (strain CCMP2712) TaxID=905079 RepID=L1JAK9_GUITC|nr:hypothetical protein GUITHDRAFT_108439 [Guillardia theta CCMP2712]EKX45566.1 hypothetical protein GUITHDRAFT_108439 [Guillardia theta CCMP2712]|eukprot:XP_005832546.1 hypothetical protein GUITHDRAFT_108439 [Guillardia theta CCMP2712]
MMLKKQSELFYTRWKAQEELWDAADAETLGLEKPIERSDGQWLQEWNEILDSADRDQAHLTHIHLYALAHILQRPIIVFSSKLTEHSVCRLRGKQKFRDIDSSWRGEKVPLILAYESSHFIEGELLPVLFVDKNKLYERYPNIVEALKSFMSCEKLPDGPLCVKYMIRKDDTATRYLARHQFESELSTHTLSMIEDFLTECHAVVTQYQMYDEELLNDQTRIPDEWRSTIDI